MSPLLEVERLEVRAGSGASEVAPLAGVDLRVERGEIVGLIGESGCGKTTLARSLIGLLSRGARVVAGTIRYDGSTVLSPSVDRLAALRGRHMSMIFQNATASLNPLLTIGKQLREVVATHEPNVGRDQFRVRAETILTRMGFVDAGRVLASYPHQLSGGMRQRAAIAVAAILEPEILIADECTTALDVTTQAEVTRLLSEVVARTGSSLLFVTHDLLLASDLCDRLVVMYAGQIVESGPTDAVLYEPRHPYTAALLRSIPGSSQELRGIPGRPPLLSPDASGCRFAPRCQHRVERCDTDVAWTEEPSGRGHRCVRWDDFIQERNEP